MKFDKTKSVWYERYKPQSVEDVILPIKIKNDLKHFIEDENMPNLGFWSNEPGLGKSSTSNAIIKDLGCDALWINASLEKGIDVLRGKIQTFASQASFDGKHKIVVMDEVDNISRDAQAAFRGFLDEFSQNCRFIFTGNYKEKIIEPLLDRLSNYDFASFEKSEMIKPVFERLKFILDNEEVKYDQKDVAKVIYNYYPKIRSMIGFLQKACVSGELRINDAELDDTNVFDNILNSLNGNFTELLQKVNSLNSPDNLYSFIYNNIEKYFLNESYPQVVITCAKYQSMTESVRDKHLNLSACLTELIKFKK